MKSTLPEVAPGAGTLDDLLGQGHVFVAGQTRSGKTEWLRHVSRETHFITVLVNPEEEVFPGFRRAPNARMVLPMIGRGERRVELVTSDNPDVAVAQVHQVQQDLFRVGDRLKSGKNKADPWCMMFVDEVQEIAQKHERMGPVQTVVRRGAKRGIHAVTASQRPADVSHTIITQSMYHVVFETSPYEAEYYRAANIPIDEVAAWTRRRWHWVLSRGGRWVPFEPV